MITNIIGLASFLFGILLIAVGFTSPMLMSGGSLIGGAMFLFGGILLLKMD